MTAGHQADLDAVDRDALQRAMEIAKRDPQREAIGVQATGRALERRGRVRKLRVPS